MPTRQDNYSMHIPVSARPPQNLSSYTRFIHDHTKRQMEAFGAMSPEPSSGRRSTSSSMTNGVAPPKFAGSVAHDISATVGKPLWRSQAVEDRPHHTLAQVNERLISATNTIALRK
ncbi:hypothetical protein HJFPF1_06757 [Paramyrothecium foliicola]|nr:hypothetical protein HJFPF1_06757 [Paramyrothecium foliicola]